MVNLNLPCHKRCTRSSCKDRVPWLKYIDKYLVEDNTNEGLVATHHIRVWYCGHCNNRVEGIPDNANVRNLPPPFEKID